MNILFLSTWHPYPPDNGSKLRVRYLLRGLAKLHQVTLISFAFDIPTSASGKTLDQLAEVHSIECDPFAANRTQNPIRFMSLQPQFVRPIPAMSSLVSNVAAKKQFDVVIASTTLMSSYALQLPKSTVRVIEEHNSLSRWMHERLEKQTTPFQHLRRWVSWRKTQSYEARLFRKFDLITMVSDQDTQTTRALIGNRANRVQTCPNGVDCEHNRPGLAPVQPDLLVYNGALTYSANYDAMRYFLAEIFPLIQAQRPQVNLTISGSTERVDLSHLKINNSVRFSGFVEDVRQIVAPAVVCIAPLRDGGGTRLKILEAMALGTPVVATSKAAEGLAVQHGEHLLIADTPVEFAAAVIRVLADCTLGAQLSTRARRLVEEKYDWATIASHFVALVEEATARQSNRIG